MHTAIKEQAGKAQYIAKSFGLSIKMDSFDEFSYNVEFSNGVTLYMTQLNEGKPIFYAVGYWNEDVVFVPEFEDTNNLILAMKNVIILPTMWDTHKKMEQIIENLLGSTSHDD